MEFFILGSGTGEPSLKRSSTSILIKTDNLKILLDIGPGTLKSFSKLAIDYYDIDYLFLSHFHPDHVLELPYLLFLYKNKNPKRRKSLNIIGPKGLKKFYKGLIYTFKDYIKGNYPLRLTEISSNRLKFKSFNVRSLPLLHTENSIGIRFEFSNGRVAVYTGDTDYCKNLIKLSRDANLLFIECSFPDTLKTSGHMSPSLIAKVASEANVNRVVLIHMYPICEKFDIIKQVKKAFDNEVLMGLDLMKVTF